LWKKVTALEADYIATGHYARKKDKKLLKGIDKDKDQSYFLWKLNQKILKHTLFPVGDYTKTEVRKLAKKFKRPVLDIPESQEICFIQTTINDFLKKHLKPKPGKIINTDGKVVGEHQGLWFYTIGQRKGIELPKGPFYVLDKDLKRNILIITKNEKDLFAKELLVKDVNWISDVRFPLKVMAKIRYRHNPVSAVVNRNKVVFTKSQRAVTPGQSVVFYRGQQVLGGGVILGKRGLALTTKQGLRFAQNK
jgi:tRNA-specific 2-thiouridylase